MGPQEMIARIARAQDGMVTAAQAFAAGLSRTEIRNLCRSRRWRRLALGTYFVSTDGGVPSRRALIRAAVASLGPRASAVFGTAAELYGIAGLRTTEEIHVSVPVTDPRAQRATDPSVVVHQLTVDPRELRSVGGILATTPVSTVAHLILRVDRYSAVSLVDSALSRGLVDDGDMGRIPAMIRGRRGAVAARRYLAEADGRAQSPLETRTRLRCVDGGVPPDVLQVDVRDDDGYLLGVGDLGWLAARVIAEADGAGPHGTPEAVFSDRRRQNLFVNAGWTVLRFTWADTLRADYIPYVVRQALRRPHRSGPTL
jgi:hypothetical protein